MGLVTTLGRGLEANLQGLKQQRASVGRKKLAQLDEPMDLAYLSVSSEYKSTAERLDDLLDTAVEEAFLQTAINHEVRQQMPVYIGSSSYNIGLAEESYQQALKESVNDDADRHADHHADRHANIVVPMPVDGFSAISSRLRQKHGLLGADFSINTACTSSANALLSASQSVSSGRSDYALVIGIEAFNYTTLSGFAGLQLLAHDEMRPFDQHRTGMILGEGCSALVLKRASAQEPGMTIVGGASGCDTYNISGSNPDGSSIARLLQSALDDAAISAAEITAIKAHGTASRLSDASEVEGMELTFPKLPPFFVLKPYIGHTLGGCGAIETALLSISLGNGFLPGTPGFELADESLKVAPITRPMNAPKGYYMLNFFGFGGNQNSLILNFQ